MRDAAENGVPWEGALQRFEVPDAVENRQDARLASCAGLDPIDGFGECRGLDCEHDQLRFGIRGRTVEHGNRRRHISEGTAYRKTGVRKRLEPVSARNKGDITAR